MSPTPTAVVVREATYIDPRAGSDKFYRVFVAGNRWCSQYGRRGTAGTFTKIVEAADEAAATKAADAKFISKVKKGYEPSLSGVVMVADMSDTGALDLAVQALPVGNNAVAGPVPIPVAADPTAITGDRRDDLTPQVVAALEASPVRAAAAVPADTAPDLPVRPMLASVQPAEVIADAMASDHWVAQFKYDGDRVVVEVDNGVLRVLNRQGQTKTRNVGRAQIAPFTALYSGRWVFDGEVVGRTLVLFDLAAASDGRRTWVRDTTPFTVRYDALTAVAAALGLGSDADGATDPVVVAPVADRAAKEEMLATAVTEQREGIILRHRDGHYEPGRRSTHLVKHKLVKDADVIVTGLARAKESATLAVYDGVGDLVEVGSASTIGKGEVAVGQVWVVAFLYVADPRFPRLVQPRLVTRRNDKDAHECVLDQFAAAGTNKAV
jgi:predicted DNA-binding WGR domain protein